jgi:pSer/pThr/pTyr-binding forkhead associated (FHA) protein
MRVMDFEKIVPLVAGKKRDTAALDAPKTDRLRTRILEARTRATEAGAWMLESSAGDGDALQRTPIQPLPFRVGRGGDLELVLTSPHVSKTHAEVYSDGEALRVRDLGSRNGTFLNRQPVSDAALHRGDVLHFGDQEFRIAGEDGAPSEEADTGTLVRRGPLPKHFETGARDLRGEHAIFESSWTRARSRWCSSPSWSCPRFERRLARPSAAAVIRVSRRARSICSRSRGRSARTPRPSSAVCSGDGRSRWSRTSRSHRSSS